MTTFSLDNAIALGEGFNKITKPVIGEHFDPAGFGKLDAQSPTLLERLVSRGTKAHSPRTVIDQCGHYFEPPLEIDKPFTIGSEAFFECEYGNAKVVLTDNTPTNPRFSMQIEFHDNSGEVAQDIRQFIKEILFRFVSSSPAQNSDNIELENVPAFNVGKLLSHLAGYGAYRRTDRSGPGIP